MIRTVCKIDLIRRQVIAEGAGVDDIIRKTRLRAPIVQAVDIGVHHIVLGRRTDILAGHRTRRGRVGDLAREIKDASGKRKA